MRFSLGIVLCFLSCNLALARDGTYRAGIIGTSTAEGDLLKYVPFIHEAANSNVDIVVLPSRQGLSSLSAAESSRGDNYDEVVNTLSEASRQAGLYVVAHLLEKTRCQGRYEMVRSNLVFGRDGEVVSVYRKPVNTVANCTSPATEIATFTTDFGVQFGLLMEEDLVIQKAKDLKSLKNFVVAGAWASDMPYLSAAHFAASWAFKNEVNLVSSAGAFAGRMGSQGDSRFADLNKAGADGYPTIPPVSSLQRKDFPEEDLSQYIIRPLDVAASVSGYRETVCHDSFCCEFYVKANFEGIEDGMNYGLAAFNGIRHFGIYDIGLQTCGIYACAGFYKRTCSFGSQFNTTNVVFEKISVHANFTTETSYPIILTRDSKLQSNQLKFETRHNNDENQVTMEMSNVENVISFGVLNRNFSKDSERQVFVEEEFLSFKDEMEELFDYLWIRLKFLIFIISIYVLEMM